MKKNKNLILTIVSLLTFLGIAMFISQFFEDVTKINLRKNEKTIFSTNDLVISDMKYGTEIKTAKDILGSPIKEEEFESDFYKYKKLSYDGLVLTFKENYDDFMLVKAEITSSKYKIGRKINVGDNILSAVRKFKISNKKGTYLYGNYEASSLDNFETDTQIYFGIRTDKQVIYLNKDRTVDGYNPYISKLTINYKHGKINKIIWSYDTK